jgi:hypothetical protein
VRRAGDGGQVQILGLRNVNPSLGLRKPSVAVYVQTADCWDAEKKLCCQFTQAKEGSDPSNQNFMETLELQVAARLPPPCHPPAACHPDRPLQSAAAHGARESRCRAQ